jgi:putative ABC transport system permease protein
VPFMLLHNARYALRLMRRNPDFTVTAVLSMALGIGANTAIFSLFYTIVLRQLPVTHPEQLLEIVKNSPTQLHWSGYWPWKTYEHLRDHSHSFSGITGVSFDNLAWVRADHSTPETLILENVPGNYFRVLGLKPALGRLIGPEDVPAAGTGDAVVVSWSYWNRKYHRDPGVIGKPVFYNEVRKTIIGVAPRDYVGPRVGSRTDVWLPVERQSVTMFARLKDGIAIRNAQAEINIVYRALEWQSSGKSNGSKLQGRLELIPAGAGLVRTRDQYAKPLIVLLTIVALLLLLACINMASLLLARSSERQRELAVRLGLGATGAHLAQQLLIEAILLSLAGAVGSILCAYAGVSVLVRILASARAFEHIEIQVHPDLHLLLFTLCIALLVGLLVGLAPAWYALFTAPISQLRHTGKGGQAPFLHLAGKALVAVQVALSTFLVAIAALFLNHLTHLRNFNLGFHSDHVLLVSIDNIHSHKKPEELAQLYQTLLTKLTTLPGVRSASMSGCTPLEGCGTPGRYISVDGRTESRESRRLASVTFISPGYFDTLRIPLLAGRDFTSHDARGPRVVVINRALARRYFPAMDPIGRSIRLEGNSFPGWFGDSQSYEVLGLVGDVKAIEIRDPPRPIMYFDMVHENQWMDQFELRTSIAPEALSQNVRILAQSVLKNARISRITTLSDQVDSNLVPERLLSILSELFGILAVVVAGVGTYGLLAYSVARRTNEIGIRMALGASAVDVSRLVLQEALNMLGIGVISGVLLVMLIEPLLVKMVQDWKPGSIWTIAASMRS